MPTITSSNIDWLELQYRQELHDRFYHQDIYVLSKKDRLAHLVLHHTKYITKIFAGEGNVKVLIDGVIVCLSIMNVCNHRASFIARSGVDSANTLAFMMSALGKLAKYVEDMDHMAFDMGVNNIGLMANQLMEAYIDLIPDDVQLSTNFYNRLVSIEEKNIFHHHHSMNISLEMLGFNSRGGTGRELPVEN